MRAAATACGSVTGTMQLPSAMASGHGGGTSEPALEATGADSCMPLCPDGSLAVSVDEPAGMHDTAASPSA